MNDKEKANQNYLEELLDGQTTNNNINENKNGDIQKPFESYSVSSVEYTLIDVNILPSAKFYKPGTKISIRPAKVSEIQAYSVVDDKNFVDITEKMNELLSRNVLYTHPNGNRGTYRDLKDADRMFIIFMIREMTFSGGHTINKDVQCSKCDHEFEIPFRSTAGPLGNATFEFNQPSDKIEKFWNKEERCYELIHNDVSWRLGAPTIGIQEDFYEEIKSEVQNDKKPNIPFMKIVPFMLYDRNSITTEGIKSKLKEFTNMNDLVLFQALNTIVNNLTFGIKGLVMNCPECGVEVHTDFTFPSGASTIFDIPDILDSF